MKNIFFILKLLALTICSVLLLGCIQVANDNSKTTTVQAIGITFNMDSTTYCASNKYERDVSPYYQTWFENNIGDYAGVLGAFELDSTGNIILIKVRSQFSDLTSDGEAMVGYYYDSYLNKYLLSFDIKYKAYISYGDGKHIVFNSADGFTLEPNMDSIINFEVNPPVSTINTGDVISLNYSGPFPTIRYNSDETTEDISISDIKIKFKALRETSVGFSIGTSSEQGGGFTIELCAHFYDVTMDKSITTVYLYNQERHGTWNDNGTELYYMPTESETELLPRNTVIYFDIPETHKTIQGRTIGSPDFFDFTLSD